MSPKEVGSRSLFMSSCLTAEWPVTNKSSFNVIHPLKLGQEIWSPSNKLLKNYPCIVAVFCFWHTVTLHPDSATAAMLSQLQNSPGQN